MGILKNMVKGLVTAGIIGAAVAFALPYIAVGLGFAATAVEAAATLGWTADPLWLGAFFGGWGSLSPVVTPAVDWLFGDAKTQRSAVGAEVSSEKSCGKCHDHAVVINNTQLQPTVDVAADVAVGIGSYVQGLKAERAAAEAQLRLVKT